MKLLLYCTKGKPLFLTYGDCDNGDYATYFEEYVCDNRYYDYEYDYKVIEPKDFLNGKIVAECDFEVEKMLLKPGPLSFGIDGLYYVCEKSKLSGKDGTLNEKCQLTNRELVDYLVFDGYAIHIKNLYIFNKPKELSNYRCKKSLEKIKVAPQNMMYVHSLVDNPYTMTGTDIETDILISISPEWLCKILNGEKTIEVRRKVLKEMKNDI